MSDEKNLNEELEEAVNDTVEEVVEEVPAEEAAEDTVEEVAVEADEVSEEAEEVIEETIEEVAEEEMSEIDKAVAEAMAARDAMEAEAKAQRNKVIKLVSIIVAAVIVVGGIVLSGFLSKNYEGKLELSASNGWLPKLCNKYNHMGFVDVTGNTIASISEQMGMEVSDFIETYGLPADMKGSTYEMAALYMMPAKNYAENICGVDFATLKEIVKIPDKAEDGTELTETTPWHVVEGEIKIADYINGAENFDEFMENYGITEEVKDKGITADSKWKNIRTIIDKSQKKMREESEEAAKQSENAPAEEAPVETEATQAPEAEATEAPAE